MERLVINPAIRQICDAFGITLAQFFAGEGRRPDLSKEQREIIETWKQFYVKFEELFPFFVKIQKREVLM